MADDPGQSTGDSGAMRALIAHRFASSARRAVSSASVAAQQPTGRGRFRLERACAVELVEKATP